MSAASSQSSPSQPDANQATDKALTMVEAPSVPILVKLVRYKLENATYFRNECLQLFEQCGDCFEAWYEHCNQIEKRQLDLPVPVDEFVALLQEISHEADALAAYSPWEIFWKGTEIKDRLSNFEEKLQQQIIAFNFEGDNTPLKQLRQTREWPQSSLRAILAPILHYPHMEAHGIPLSRSEKDAICERGLDLILDMYNNVAPRPDSTLQVAGVALTRAQFNVFYAEVAQAVTVFAFWSARTLPGVLDLGAAVRVIKMMNWEHWSEVYLGAYCDTKESPWVAVKTYRRLDSRHTKIAMEGTLAILKAWSASKVYDHPNIHPTIGVSDKAGYGFTTVAEWVENRDIRTYTKEHPEVMHADVYRLLAEAAEGIIHLHEHGVIHGNMKGSNILISDDHHALITDFGLSRALLAAEHAHECATWAKERSAHYARWRAPEACDDAAPSAASDVWEFGMAVLEVLTGAKPYPELRMDAGVSVLLCRKDYAGPRRPECAGIGDALWEVMQGCWRHRPEERVGMGEIRDALRREERVRRERHVPASDGVDEM